MLVHTFFPGTYCPSELQAVLAKYPASSGAKWVVHTSDLINGSVRFLVYPKLPTLLFSLLHSYFEMNKSTMLVLFQFSRDILCFLKFLYVSAGCFKGIFVLFCFVLIVNCVSENIVKELNIYWTFVSFVICKPLLFIDSNNCKNQHCFHVFHNGSLCSELFLYSCDF